MPCSKCAVDPTAHSFHYIGQLGDVKMFYTDAGAATDPDKDKDIDNLMLHLEEARGHPWIWFFNCRGMVGGSPGHSIALAKRIQADHEQLLQKLYVIHPNMWFTWVLTILKPIVKSSLIDRLDILKEKGLALYMRVRKLGLDNGSARKLL